MIGPRKKASPGAEPLRTRNRLPYLKMACQEHWRKAERLFLFEVVAGARNLKITSNNSSIVLRLLSCLAFVLCGALADRTWAAAGQERPNILWVMTDDMGPELGCYGTKGMRTPNIDRLAAEGMRFTRCFTTAPVCSPSRSAIMTGMYQTYINAHDHRSVTDLPKEVRLITDLFRDAGYFVANLKKIGPHLKSAGKTDLNFRAGKLFDGENFDLLKGKQPFFAQFQIFEPHRGSWKEGQKEQFRVDPQTVVLPPYYPDTSLARNDWAGYLSAINSLDVKVGAILELLEEAGMADNTVIFFFADNGRCHVRDKQWLYEGGLHIPLIVRFPKKLNGGTVREDLISAIDISATSLHLAGISLPNNMQGRNFLGQKTKQRPYIFGARDRCGEAEDRIRSVRNERYKLIVNFMPERPYTQPNAYKDGYPMLKEMKQLHAEGKLTAVQARFMAPRKPEEELYDLTNDPDELKNLSGSSEHRKIKRELRTALDKWMKQCDDRPEKKGELRP